MKTALVVGGLLAAGSIVGGGFAFKKRRAAHRAEQHRRDLERFEDEGGRYSMPI